MMGLGPDASVNHHRPAWLSIIALFFAPRILQRIATSDTLHMGAVLLLIASGQTKFVLVLPVVRAAAYLAFNE